MMIFSNKPVDNNNSPYNSNEITSISINGIIDATNEECIYKYKNNLKLLVEQAKKDKKINKFMLIRNDNFFPYNFQWLVNSKDTGIERVGNNFSYEIKTNIAEQNLGVNINAPFHIPVEGKKLQEEMMKLDKYLGSLYTPVKFRSTKHFTINTPLKYTGEYNNVESGRDFTIIDTIDNFLNSDYAYSMSYRDAYLDITHEPLKISENGIVLMSEEKYQTLKNDINLMNEISKHKLIIYRGDEAVAINMLLTELGVLPSRPGNKYIEYDKETLDILENSIKEKAYENNILYDQSHGNLFGKGGHFSDLLDGYNHDELSSKNLFISYLKQRLPKYNNEIDSSFFNNMRLIDKIIKEAGTDNLLNIINDYNKLALENFKKRYINYINDRKTITPEISNLFKTTLNEIKNYYYQNEEISLDLQSLFIEFFHGDSVLKQKNAALQICEHLNTKIKR